MPTPRLPAELDVLVLGCGPAAAAVGASLADRHRVALVGRAATPGAAVGECLPAAARRPLQELDAWDAFVAQGHRPAWSRVSCWGSAAIEEHDALRDPEGGGWHLDRGRFDALLLDQARTRGALVVQPGELRGLAHAPELAGARWQARIDTGAGAWTPRCRVVIDASGRAARVVRHTGGELVRGDRLVARVAWLVPAGPGARAWPGATLTEATPHGWWYSADLADGSVVLAWHGDADLAEAAAPRTADHLLFLARQTRLVAARCAGARPIAPLRVVPAHGQWPRQACGADWLAIGDASLAFDPIASQGLLHALVTGRCGAASVCQHLAGDPGALPAWGRWLDAVRAAYVANRARCYASEPRWTDAPFWRRRHAAPQAARRADASATA